VTERRRIATSVVVATLALAVALGVQPIAVNRILSAYVLVLAAIALAALTRVLRGASELPPPSDFAHALRPRAAVTVRPPELVRTEREITLGMSNAWHMHTRLLPLLRDVAAARGIDFVRRPGVARELLGDDTFELLHPDRPAPDDRSAPGLPLARVRAAVETLERL
jgi:hypothetical protein